MQAVGEQGSPELARKLRELRERSWNGVRITQGQLAEALGGDRRLSESLISSWENHRRPIRPPRHRLSGYSTIFATRRSVEGGRLRMLDNDELTDEERNARDQLYQELIDLGRYERPPGSIGARAIPVVRTEHTIGTGTWLFTDPGSITIICGRLPKRLREQMPHTDPDDPDYTKFHGYADLDSLIELHGHLRAVNPGRQVNIRLADRLTEDDYTTHLVLLGGVDWNPMTRGILRRLDLPVGQHAGTDPAGLDGYFEALTDAGTQRFGPILDEGTLQEDVTHFFRGRNPYDSERTVTICNGMFGRGTYGAVRALTDARLRDRNEKYLVERFAGQPAFSILSRVFVGVNGETLTPDWTVADNRLHEWPGPGEEE